MKPVIAILCVMLSCLQFAHAQNTVEAATKLRQAEIQWRHAAPKSYSLKVSYSAFILEYGCEVQSFHVTGRHSTADRSQDCKPRKGKFGSVPALFRFAHELLAQKRDEAIVNYDPTYGYPTKVYVGSSQLEDSYFMFEVIDFKVIETKGNH